MIAMTEPRGFLARNIELYIVDPAHMSGAATSNDMASGSFTVQLQSARIYSAMPPSEFIPAFSRVSHRLLVPEIQTSHLPGIIGCVRPEIKICFSATYRTFDGIRWPQHGPPPEIQ